MTAYADLPDGWVVWNDEPDGRSILAYRPDVFDSHEFPAACLPTIYVTDGPIGRRRPEARGRSVDGTWNVALFLEPEVTVTTRRFDDRDAAVRGAIELAREFADGSLAYRSAYQVPREAYLAELDSLLGREV